MLKIGLALAFIATLVGSPLAVWADDIPGLEPLGAPGSIGAPGLSLDSPGLTGGGYSSPAAVAQASLSYRNPLGTVPAIGPDFWKGYSFNRVSAGTILTGVMEDTISSGSNKAGDIFSIRLEDGFPVDGDKQLIPKLSKIVGSIVRTTPAHHQRNAMPGQIDISLQTLVFPDGSTTPIYGYLDHNPAADLKQKPGTQIPNPAAFGQQTVRGLVSLVTGRVGMNIRMPVYGADCKIEKGEAVPIRISRPLDLSKMTPPPQQTAQSPQPSNNFLFQPAPAGSAPSKFSYPPADLPMAPATSSPAQSAGPSLPLSGVPGLMPSSTVAPDANSVFTAPLHAQQPQADLPDPF